MSGLRMRAQLVLELSLKLSCYHSWIWHKRKHFFFHLKSSAPYLFLDPNSLFQAVCSFDILSITVPCLCTSFSTSEILQHVAGCHLNRWWKAFAVFFIQKYVSVLFSTKWELLSLLQSTWRVVFHFYRTQDEKWFLLLFGGWFTQPHFKRMA